MSNFNNYFRNLESQEDITFMKRVYLSLIRKFPKLNYKFNVILKLPKNAKILDVGCGECSFLKLINTLRPDIKLYGIDITDEIFNKIKLNVVLKKASANKIPYKNNFFDLVVSQHVLEHTSEPLVVIKELIRVSKNKIIIVTPNQRTVFIKGELNFFSDITHIRPFTKMSFKQASRILNFNIEYLEYERYINIPWLALLFLMPYYIAKRDFINWYYNIRFKMGLTMVIAKK